MLKYIFMHKYLAYVLSQINFETFRKDVLQFKKTTHVLMEYKHSGVSSILFISSRVPGTVMLVHNIFTEQFLYDLNKILDFDDSMIYTRRKKDKDGNLTDVRQLVIKLDPNAPPPLIHINEARNY